MADITKIKIWKILNGSNHFWITTIILYLQQRGLSISQALLIISIFSLLSVLLEYPTGVIGDYFSHRISVLLGSIITVFMHLLFSFEGNFYYYLFVGGVMPAFAFSLVSGSDTALIHSVSKDFKKDISQITPIALLLSAVNTIAGGLLASIDIRYPYYATFLYSAISLPFLFGLKTYRHTREEGNIFETAKNGITDVFSSKTLKDITIISSVFGAFFISIKWFYNPLFEELQIPVEFWGFIASIAFLFVALGAYIFKKKDNFSLLTTSIAMLLSIFIIGITGNWFLPIVGIWILHIVRGYQDTHLGILMNKAITTNRRSSILSFNSLLIRLISAIYIFGVGYLLPASSFLIVLTLTCLVIGFLAFAPLRRLANFKISD